MVVDWLKDRIVRTISYFSDHEYNLDTSHEYKFVFGCRDRAKDTAAVSDGSRRHATTGARATGSGVERINEHFHVYSLRFQTGLH